MLVIEVDTDDDDVEGEVVVEDSRSSDDHGMHSRAESREAGAGEC